ncbi:hypothetical protein ACFFMN_42560 [Planobispora siamensis]|uniref:NB-ARC domain-containing protein n=1 Tax=Planobispora siamensis TaxID=936338 RepID=A0A8J3SNM1_9ACTN|nr:hypothetical protein [Planobispora siamensis]GIH97721.1 hypothetical protein Psi01_83510 [Planobispora siamensis]
MPASPEGAAQPRHRWRSAALGALVGGAALFFLADPLDLPDPVLARLDQRDSVISMLVGLVGLGVGGAALWLQLRSSAAAANAGSGPTTSGDGSPGIGTVSGGMVVGQVTDRAQVSGPGSAHAHGAGPAIGTHTGPLAIGERAVAVGAGNRAPIHTGDVHLPPAPPPLPALAGVPAPPPDFTGRDEIRRQLLECLTPHAERTETASKTAVVLAAAVAGMAGVGKTALALVAAHQVLKEGWYPGGVFFVDLHGYTPGQIEPVEAAAGQLLRAMGHRDQELPATGPEMLALYRSVLAERAQKGRGVLVVADNAAEAGQVEPLVPAQDCHRLLVTSRHTLPVPARPAMKASRACSASTPENSTVV